MKTITTRSLGLEFPVQVPSSAEEYDQAAGKEGACLDSAVDNALYRGHLAKFRTAFIKAVEAETGEPREVLGKDDKGKDVLEKEGVYFKRVSEGAGKPKESFAALAQSVAESLGALDLTPQRSTGPTKEFIAAAEALRQGITDGKTTTDAVISKLVSANASITEIAIDDENLPEVTALASALRINRDRAVAEANASLF